MNEILAGPPLVNADTLIFRLPCSALDALKALEQRLGMKTVEEKKPWCTLLGESRILVVDGMKLRINFTSSGDSRVDPLCMVVARGFERTRGGEEHFSGPAAYACYIRFLDRITPAVLEQKARELRLKIGQRR